MPKKATTKKAPTKKVSKVTGSLTRIQTIPVLHWSQRHKFPNDHPVKAKSANIVAESIEEASALTVALDLLQGEGPKTLQASFNKAATEVRTEFDKVLPGFDFKPGGRKNSKAETQPA